jgi:hypothetical protein
VSAAESRGAGRSRRLGSYIPASTSGSRPIAFLGVAGVIYLDEAPATPVVIRRVSAWGRWSRRVAIPVAAPEQVAALRGAFDIVWISEWGHNAHTAFQADLRLPAEPWPSLPVQFGKLDAIRRYAGDLAWAWIDDPLVIGDDAVDARDARGLVVPTDPRQGIASVDVLAVIRDAGG